MSEDSSFHSFADDDCSSESETQQRRIFRINDDIDHHGDANASGSLLFSPSSKEEYPTGANGIRSFDHYDQDSDRFDDEIDAPKSSEEEQLVREIEFDQRVDEELGRKLTRAALLNSPLLMAATSEVVKSGGTQGSFFPREAATADLSKGTYSTVDYRDTNGSNASDVDQDLYEDDYLFAGSPGIAVNGQGGPYGVDESMDHTRGGSNRAVRFRRNLYIVGWTVAVLLVIALVVAIGIRQTTRSRDTPNNPAPSAGSLAPTRSPQPTVTAQPTVSRTVVPSETPTAPLRTRSPSTEAAAPTEEPFSQTMIPTNRENLPSSLPVSLASSSPTSQPSLVTLAPSLLQTALPSSQSSDTSLPTPQIPPVTTEPALLPTLSPSIQQTAPTSQPLSSATTSPTKNPSISPSLTPEETQRRADIKALFVSISGVLVLMDSRSPQYKAMQWIFVDDPLELMANNTPALVQRYALSTLYYATLGDTAWTSCGPPSGSSPCSTQVRRFLSGAPECLWLGVSCDFNQEITGINIRK